MWFKYYKGYYDVRKLHLELLVSFYLYIYIYTGECIYIRYIYSLLLDSLSLTRRCVCLLVLFGEPRARAAHPVPILSESRSSTGTILRVCVCVCVFLPPIATWKTCANLFNARAINRHGLVDIEEIIIRIFFYILEACDGCCVCFVYTGNLYTRSSAPISKQDAFF